MVKSDTLYARISIHACSKHEGFPPEKRVRPSVEAQSDALETTLRRPTTRVVSVFICLCSRFNVRRRAPKGSNSPACSSFKNRTYVLNQSSYHEWLRLVQHFGTNVCLFVPYLPLSGTGKLQEVLAIFQNPLYSVFECNAAAKQRGPWSTASKSTFQGYDDLLRWRV